MKKITTQLKKFFHEGSKNYKAKMEIWLRNSCVGFHDIIHLKQQHHMINKATTHIVVYIFLIKDTNIIHVNAQKNGLFVDKPSLDLALKHI